AQRPGPAMAVLADPGADGLLPGAVLLSVRHGVQNHAGIRAEGRAGAALLARALRRQRRPGVEYRPSRPGGFRLLQLWSSRRGDRSRLRRRRRLWDDAAQPDRGEWLVHDDLHGDAVPVPDVPGATAVRLSAARHHQ